MSISSFVEPVAPTNLTIFASDAVNGVYLVGHDIFRVANLPLTDLFRRELTPIDDFLLGVLSIVFIAVVSDILYSLLLRTTDGYVSPLGLLAAFLVNELTHVRNIMRHLRRPGSVSRGRVELSPILLSVVVLAAVIIPLVADVLVIVMTQPKIISSGSEAYNLVGIQPVLMNESMSEHIRTLSYERRCVNPSYWNRSTVQTRRYIMQACFDDKRDHVESDADNRGADVAYEVNMTSFFHVHGFDHRISTALGWQAARLRVQVLVNTDDDSGVRQIMFQKPDNNTFIQTKYLHELVMYRAKKEACKSEYGITWCASHAKRETKASSVQIVQTELKISRIRERQSVETVVGVQSTFRETLPDSSKMLGRGMELLFSSAAVKEIRGPGRYMNKVTGEEESGIPGLLTEVGRVCGVMLLSVVTVLTFLLMFAIRLILRPVSLGEIAADIVDSENGEVKHPWRSSARHSLNPSNVERLGSNVVRHFSSDVCSPGTEYEQNNLVRAERITSKNSGASFH